jgi:hypothetical protein
MPPYKRHGKLNYRLINYKSSHSDPDQLYRPQPSSDLAMFLGQQVPVSEQQPLQHIVSVPKTPAVEEENKLSEGQEAPSCI